MKIIAKLVDFIDDELEGAEDYAECAIKQKAERPRLADKFIELAETEMNHMRILHQEAVKLIDEIRQSEGEPPRDMLAVYEYEHAKQTKRAAVITQMIAEYRNS
jgi:ferritin-like protein